MPPQRRRTTKKATSRAQRATTGAVQAPEQLGDDKTGTTVINGTTFAGKQVTYAEVDGLAIFEGDIVLGRAEDLVGTAERSADIAFGVAITGSHFRWPNADVPYEIDPAMPDQHRVNDAIAHWESNTPIRFILRTAANAGQHPNYVRFFSGGGCFSAVGMMGGRQDISLGSGCSTGNAIHEIGHAIGLWHEQSREDRNTFVTIVFANIDPSKVHNFNQHVTDGDDIGAYDYGSIMHYPATAFSTNGQATIVPTQPGVTIGQRTGLSPGDIAAVHAIYPGIVRPGTFKKVRDDQPVVTFKKARDDRGHILVKKVQDDQPVVTFKKARDDRVVTKPIADLRRPGGVLPFSLAMPHHAAAAGAWEGGATGDPVSDLLAQSEMAAAAVAEASELLSATLQQLMAAQEQVVALAASLLEGGVE